jgi:tRNA (cytidine/uridine-2'-O-)-methyltransferase
MISQPTNPFHIVLVSPQIPPNTGNIARLCACTGARLILVEPLGFSIADRDLKRAGLDYWKDVFFRLYKNYDAYLSDFQSARRFLFSARVDRSCYSVRYQPGDHLVFGSETKGLGPEILESKTGEVVTIPMLDDRRSLNLSTAVGIATYEAIRQVQLAGLH